MNEFRIGIIGGTGGIGRWFAGFFKAQGIPVEVTGRRSGLSLPELASRCRVVIVSVPIAATTAVIREIGPLLPADALLMDFTSLKAEPVREMLAATKAEAVGCHPLFGPDCPSLSGQNVILCPGRGEVWLGRMQALFNEGGARVTVTTPEEHDRMMALTQGLPHLDSLLMGLALREAGVTEERLAAFSTPVFRTRQALAAKVFGPSPDLYAGLLTGNAATAAILEIYARNLERLKELILRKDAAGLAALIRNRASAGHGQE
ncbi:MAG: prephenate dehydrogenase/arogenate dehydrogenase family protein [Deltaproteobacteria bacterium]|nr:prephenate dehydrogenase/arogenate dehydrogenase family protein [Deltaproteobacteria bacterium]